MVPPFRYRWLLCLCVWASACPTADADDIETMIVSAGRTPVAPDESGSSVSVITAGDLQRLQLASLSDVLRDVPGLAVSRSGGPGSSTQVRVRGAEANHVLVLIDGVEANDAAQGDEFNFANTPTDGIERIEIVRGPQSALWGSDALAGVINIVTARGAGPLSVSAFAEGGSFATVRMGGSLGVGAGDYRVNLGGSWLDSGGSNVSRQGHENDGFGVGTVSFNGAYSPMAGLELSAGARHESSLSQFDDIDFATGLPADSDVESHTQRDYARAQADLSLLGGRWRQRLEGAFAGTRNDNFSDGAGTGRGAARRLRVGYQGSLLLDAAWPIASAHVFTLGLEGEFQEFRQRGPRTPYGDPNRDLGVQSRSIVGEYRLRAGASLSLSAGVRHDSNSDFAGATTLRFTSSWAPVRLPGTRLHASWGEGVKNPTFSDRFGFYADSIPPFIGNPDLRPERSRGWDAGVSQPLPGGAARLEATWFEARLSDEIDSFAFDPARGAFTALNGTGSSRRRGLELGMTAAPIAGLDLGVHYTWLDADQPEPSGGRAREVRRPRHSASMNANYAFAANCGNLNLNVAYTGAQLDTFFPPFPRPAEPVTLHAFTLVTLAASWRFNDRLGAYARVENLLDQDYEEVYGFRAPGIGVYAGVRVGLRP